MPTKIFEKINGNLNELKTNGLENLMGLWTSIEIIDIDNDGDQDMLLGNIGENFAYTISKENPVKLWVADFDDNGMLDKVFTKSIKGEDSPIFLKRDMMEQFPQLKNANLKHSEYAKKKLGRFIRKSKKRAS